MIPIIALIGRPNVGKSTFFNRLTKTANALVTDFPGLTRDRQYGHAEIENHKFIIIDTGGINGIERIENIQKRMTQQSFLAIEEADVVLFIVDARAGLLPADLEIAQHLRKRKKATFLVANKIDGMNSDTALTDFYSLALGKVYGIAASHGRGVAQLMSSVITPFLPEKPIVEISEEKLNCSYWEKQKNEVNKTDFLKSKKFPFNPESLAIKLAIVGRPNVGKSTLINRILAQDRMLVYDIPGTTRDSIYIPLIRNNREYIFIDTAGVRKSAKIKEKVEKFSVIKTLQAIEDANVVLLVIDANEGVSDQDLSLLHFILNSGRSLVISVNKWDAISSEKREQIKNSLDLRLGFIDFARMHFISALRGSGVENLFKSIKEAYDCSTKRINTALLTRIMQLAKEEHEPPLVRGRRVKLKYAHSGGYNPLIVVIHGNQVNTINDSYKRYLMNYFRRSLKMIGAPIRIQFKESENPFAGKQNTLTPNQVRKRKRLRTHLKKKLN
ncbi:ribosome biogenesis GTPase Der [Candidatus Williamhamiltonella defendens]|uniref:ribosome biogenesis GTPase Der n=1 Tax=Candidatus Williamhamiltonella defendens TaxID=138072 RepID=UPI00130DD053|nr:ribosome biogenesis GTPase Der [Candidatus Hamiltonella defensa]